VQQCVKVLLAKIADSANDSPHPFSALALVCLSDSDVMKA
jgi:hypothetical protein